MTRATLDRWAGSLPPRRRRLAVVALVAVLLVSALSATVPSTTAALTARVTNGTNTAAAAAYFTCAAAYAASTPGIYYRMNETSGTVAADSSSTGSRAGAYRGTVTFGVAGPCPRDTGAAVTLNGSTGYLGYATALTSSGTFTVETWFKTTTGRGGQLVGFGAAATGASASVDRQVWMASSGQVVYGINSAAKKVISSPNAYNDGAWHHTMATQSAAGMRLYVDGVLVASDPTVAATTSYSGFFRLGYDNLAGWPGAPASLFFAGSLDEGAG